MMDKETTRGAAEKAFSEFQFPLVVEDVEGWDIEAFTPGTVCQWSRVLFFENPEGGDSIRGRFSVYFYCSTADDTVDLNPYLIEVDMADRETIRVEPAVEIKRSTL